MIGLFWGMTGVLRAQNLPGNPDFEHKPISPWQWGVVGGAKAAGEVDTKVFHGGQSSFRISNESAQAPNVFGMISQTLPVKPNTRYEFSVWSKGEKVGNAWIGGGPAWEIRVRFPAGTYDWQKFSGTFMTGPKETTFNMMVAVESTTENLWLDDVEMTAVATLEPEEYTVTETSLAPTEAVAAKLGAGFPDALGICVFGFTHNPGELDQFAETGVKIVRTNMHWAEAEPQKGKFDEDYWKTMKSWVDSYAKHGIRMMFILAYGNPAYGGEWGEMAKTKERRAAFARFAAEAATQFKERNVLFELWNEPDGAVTAEEYMSLAKVTIPAMRKANPNVVIVGPAAHHYATAWLERCLKYGLLKIIDAVSFHLYFGIPPAPQPMPEFNAPVVAEARKLVAQYAGGRSVPIINSEWGYKRRFPADKPEYSACVSTSENAKYLPRVFLLSQLWDLKFNAWFCWWSPDSSIKSDGDYALVTPERIPMPSYYAMANLTRQLPKGHFKRRIDVGSKDDYVLEFDTATGLRWAVWTVGNPHQIQLPTGEVKRVKVTDFTGTRIFPLSAGQSGGIVLSADDGVQYVQPE